MDCPARSRQGKNSRNMMMKGSFSKPFEPKSRQFKEIVTREKANKKLF
jgi:hypothetical protein